MHAVTLSCGHLYYIHTCTWPSSRLDYVFLSWALQFRGIGNKPVPIGPCSIWSSSKFCPGSIRPTISTLHFWHWYSLIFLNFSKFFLFPKKFPIFFRQKFFLMTYFSQQLQILNFHLFSLFHYISPYFWEIIILPTFANSPTNFVTCLLYILCVFRFPS